MKIIRNLVNTKYNISISGVKYSWTSLYNAHHTILPLLILLTETEPDALEKLVQWSDLMLFDYLTGNYDRVASMLDGAEKERRPAVLRETVHNLGLRCVHIKHLQ